MANLPEDPAVYPAGVRRIETGEKAFGTDATKPPNEQFLTLASRTAFLKAQLDAIAAQIAGLNTQISEINTALNGLTIGEEVQAFDPILQAIAAIPSPWVANNLLGTDGLSNVVIRAIPSVAVAILQDNKASFAGTGNSTAWLTRDLNTIEAIGASFCTLSLNVFTLPAGSYLLIARVPATMVDKHQARLYNVTDGVVAKVGSSTQTLDAAAVSGQSFITDSWVITAFTLSSSKQMRIEHRIYATIVDRSLGAECSTGLGEVYTQVAIVKIANA